MCRDNFDVVSMLKRSPKLVGLKQVLSSVGSGKLRCVVLAPDADPDIRGKVLTACIRHSVEVINYASKAELGKLCGIEVACATVGILKAQNA